jgi:hypothetical protein
MGFLVARLRSQSVPLVKNLEVAEGEAFHKGALLIENEYGEWQEVASDAYDKYQGPIDGTALCRYGIDGTVPYDGAPSFDILGGFGFPPGNVPAAVVVQGDREKWWDAEYVGTLPTVVGGSYGVIRGSDGKWRVDFADTTTAVVRLESLVWSDDPLNKNRVVVSFLADLSEE